MTRIPSSSTIKFHSRLWKRREGKYSFQYWPFRESGWNKKTVSWIFLQKNLITVYRINQSLENAIVTAPFYVLHARDTREEGGRGRRGARPKFRENSWKRPRRETRRGTNDNDVPKTIDIDRAIEGKWWKNMQSRGGERREGGRERRGEKWRGEEEIGGGEDDKKREKEGGWMAERYGIWEMRTRFFSFFSFFFLFFSFFSFSPSLRSTKPIYRFLDLRREYFRCHYRMILWCTSYCERSRGRRDGEEREWKNMSCGLWSIYPLMINYWIDRRFTYYLLIVSGNVFVVVSFI